MASETTTTATARVTGAAYGWAVLETAIVFLLLTTPLMSDVFVDLLFFGPLGLVVLYWIWPQVNVSRRRDLDPPSQTRTALFSLGQLLAAMMVAGGLSTVVFGLWMNTAYRQDVVSPHSTGFDFPFSLSVLAPLAGGLVVAAAAIFLGSTVFLRRDNERARDVLRRILSGGMRPLLPALNSTLLLGFGVASIFNVMSSVGALPSLLEAANPSRDVDGWFLVSEFPGLIAAILAAAILLVAFRRSQPMALTCLRGSRCTVGGRAPATVAVLEGICIFYSILAFYGWLLYLVHVGMIAALGPVMMIAGWQAASDETSKWITAEQDAGRNQFEIAADLNRFGRWNGAEPGAGLAEIFPGLEGALNAAGLDTGCSIALDAGAADNSVLEAQDWIRDVVDESGPLPEIGYCLRMACPSPVVWHEHPVVILESSHPSRNRYWAGTVFLDLFGNGRAVEPGGYCTADGRLAESYQG